MTHTCCLTVISESEILLLRKNCGLFMRIEPKPTVQQLGAYSTRLSCVQLNTRQAFYGVNDVLVHDYMLTVSFTTCLLLCLFYEF